MYVDTRTHCHAGHALTPENVYVRKNTRRQCRICQRDAVRRHDRARRATDKKSRYRATRYVSDNAWRVLDTAVTPYATVESGLTKFAAQFRAAQLNIITNPT